MRTLPDQSRGPSRVCGEALQGWQSGTDDAGPSPARAGRSSLLVSGMLTLGVDPRACGVTQFSWFRGTFSPSVWSPGPDGGQFRAGVLPVFGLSATARAAYEYSASVL